MENTIKSPAQSTPATIEPISQSSIENNQSPTSPKYSPLCVLGALCGKKMQNKPNVKIGNLTATLSSSSLSAPVPKALVATTLKKQTQSAIETLSKNTKNCSNTLLPAPFLLLTCLKAPLCAFVPLPLCPLLYIYTQNPRFCSRNFGIF